MWRLWLAFVCFAVGVGSGLRAAAPAAGSTIGNQASATYTDSVHTQHTATSNVTLTVVQQVASFTLTASQAKSVAPGGQVVLPHTLVNTGNGNDTFSLSAANLTGDHFDLAGLVLYADVNGDGLPDNATAVNSTGVLPAGGRFTFVMVGTVPSSQTSPQTGLVRVTAASLFDATQTSQNTDTVAVSSNAVVHASLSVNPSSGVSSTVSSSGPYTFTLTFTNTGNAAATALTLTDVLPVGLNYLAGSARWSVSGATPLSDAAGGDPAGMAYDYGVTVAGRVTAVVSSLAAGQSGTLTFDATVLAGVAPGSLANIARFSYHDGSSVLSPVDTNAAVVTLAPTAALSITGATVAVAAQGSTVSFANLVTNHGLSAETFEMTLSGSSFPAGTTFRLVRSDGATNLLDSNGNGTVDTGPVAAGATFSAVLRATLPPGATGGPFTVTHTATAASNPAATASAVDTLTAIAASTVDLTANAGATQGVGAGPESSAVVTQSGNPGATLTFLLNVKNSASVADSYELSASSVSNFSTLGLPAGWTVVFRKADGTVVTRTDSLSAGASQILYADVAIPAGQAAGIQEVYFQVVSPVTGAADGLHDAVIVNSARSLVVTPNHAGQVFPGGSVVFAHSLKNAGNVLEGNNVGSAVGLAATVNLAGWTATVYFDANGNGQIDAGENPVTDTSFVSAGAAGLAAGESVSLLVKVFAPNGTAGGRRPASP